MKNINIAFPFKDSERGFYLKLNTNDSDAIKSDLLHLILTDKGERLYLPDFGANLRKHLFEPNDQRTQQAIREEIESAIAKYIPNLQLNDVNVTPSQLNEHRVDVRLDYNVTEGAFQRSDFVVLEL